MITYNQRGFGRINFTDSRDNQCSLQESNRADDQYIWLGINDVRVIEYDGTPTEIDLSRIGRNVRALGRMQLNREQVTTLLPYLQRFARLGNMEAESKDESDTQRFEAFAVSKGVTYFDKNADGTYKESTARVLSDTWDAAQQDFNDRLVEREERKRLDRDVKFRKGCECGCNEPSFTEPWEALRFLMHRMNGAGVGSAVAESYAWDIMQILKKHNQVEDPK